MRPFAAIREEAGLFCGHFLRKGQVFARFGLHKVLRDLQGPVGQVLRLKVTFRNTLSPVCVEDRLH